MDKVVTNILIGSYKDIGSIPIISFSSIEYINVLYLRDDLTLIELQPIVDWCNKNLEDYISIGINGSSTFKDLTQCLQHLEQHYVNPKLRFVLKSDMVAFKLRWMDVITLLEFEK